MNIFIIAHFVTASLVVAKLIEATTISWWVVFSPSLTGLVIAFILGTWLALRQELGKRR